MLLALFVNNLALAGLLKYCDFEGWSVEVTIGLNG